MNATRDQARRAKPKAGEAARACAPVVGVGLARVGDSWVVKVNLGEAVPGARLPQTIDGVPVVYEVVGRVVSRGGAGT